ncbi:flagellar hook-associated protein FlgK [Sphingomonas sp. BIUV-7]|uniref:Flagellar hook-associated protein 1 n=1 Tax=Sphingomonas natans TaxID=3063330 RepID=A0ABT8YE01_9SPHN|nr:flagellar hook-associated protein FlgK [Sphingomonas sp. BIUV-7]MDO6416546.1 flagellar hook-associated protein FlgK [Sphingomonas sp. BIUV-7]
MSDLLSIGRSGVLAYQGALQTIGENVTNADTAGYSRRSVVLKEQSTYIGAFSLNRSAGAFGGVQATGVQRVWDQYKASNAWTSNSDASGASTRTQYLSTVESLLNDSDTGLGTRLTAIFATATQLSANPADTGLRQAFLGAVSDATTAFHTTAANLTKLSGTISTQANLLVGQSNDALDNLAKINLALRITPSTTAARAQLEDQRDALLGTLSGAMAIDTTFAADGSVSVRMNDVSGPLLLSNTAVSASQVRLQTATDGRLSISVQTEDDTTLAATPTGGALAGLVDGAATTAGRRQQLDGMATGLVDLLNGFQAAGLTDAGVAGTDMLAGTDAASIKLVDPFGIADIAAAGVAPPDPAAPPVDPLDPPVPPVAGAANGNLLALVGDNRGPDGLEQRWKTMVTDQSLQVSSAKLQESAASTRKDTAYTALDETTGVDLDNEAAELLRFQQAYSASAKVIQAARETLQTILDLF